ncbi:MBL fold metallo-hydrolase [Brucellaceae bacterium C25G]
MSDASILRLTILGCGSSPGVPRINGDWGACDPQNPKNKRRRASLLVERISPSGDKTVVVIDTGPDFRAQMIDAKVSKLDAVVYTHPHADHIHGIDDLRTYVNDNHSLMNIYANAFTQARLDESFGYCFVTPKGSGYPPILRANAIDNQTPFSIDGAGGILEFQPLSQRHGDIESLGFRIGKIAYCTDVSAFPQGSPEKLENLDLLIIDALQYKPHVSHFSLEEALEWIDKLQPKQAILTHMHIPLDYETLRRQLPNHIEPAYDGMQLDFTMND